jgi:hypothetical protein
MLLNGGTMAEPVTAVTLAAYVGQTARLITEGMDVDVRILNAKQAYGHLRVLVAPIRGEGAAWVGVERVRLPKGKGG